MRRVALTYVSVMLLAATMGDVCAGDASAHVEKTVNKLLGVLKDPALQGEGKREQRREQIRAILKKEFDLALMARLSLGKKEWGKLDSAGQDEFVDVFAKLVENTYMDTLERYDNETVKVDKEQSGKRGRALVETRIVSEAKELPIHYKMRQKSGHWLVYDMLIEGVSVVKNYQEQFRSFIKKESCAALVEELRKKNQ